MTNIFASVFSSQRACVRARARNQYSVCCCIMRASVDCQARTCRLVHTADHNNARRDSNRNPSPCTVVWAEPHLQHILGRVPKLVDGVEAFLLAQRLARVFEAHLWEQMSVHMSLCVVVRARVCVCVCVDLHVCMYVCVCVCVCVLHDQTSFSTTLCHSQAPCRNSPCQVVSRVQQRSG